MPNRIPQHTNGSSDPTLNVRQLISEAVERLDSLREAERCRLNEAIEAERRRVNEQAALRAEFSSQLSLAEAKRIDAIRAVDVNAVSVANERATAQAAVLANQVSASAERRQPLRSSWRKSRLVLLIVSQLLRNHNTRA